MAMNTLDILFNFIFIIFIMFCDEHYSCIAVNSLFLYTLVKPSVQSVAACVSDIKCPLNTFTASNLNTHGLNNSCLKSRQRRP